MFSYQEERAKEFDALLKMIEHKTMERIKQYPQVERRFFLNSHLSWLKCVAQDPLDLTWYNEVEHGDDFNGAGV